MTDIYGGELLDVLPAPMKENNDVIAISYALKKRAQEILRYVPRAAVWAAVDDLPDDILDYLAVESDAPYYDPELPIAVKRALVKGARKWRRTVGTKAAVEGVVSEVFGSGEVIEWFEYEDGDGEPGHFKIVADVALTPDSLELFQKMIDRVKNASSRLEELVNRAAVRQYRKWAGAFPACAVGAAVEANALP